MKTKLNAILTSVALLTSLTVHAEEMAIPKIDAPTALQEGTQRELSAAQIAELLPWAKDSKVFLTDLIDHAQSLPMDQRIDRLSDGIKQVVVESAPKNSELIMRYALNRALVLNDILNKEMDEAAVGTADAKARVLMASVKLALKYYDSDMANLSKKTALPYAAFGVEYFSFLNELNKSIFDASAQYNIQRTALEFLQWDLYRDLNNTSYASQIVKINNALKIFPTKKLSDAHSINYIRQMKKTTEQLNIVIKKEDSILDNSSIFAKKEEVVTPVKKGNFRNYNGDCYAADKNNNILWDAGKMDWRSCHSGNYKSYNGECYPTDSSSNILWSSGKVNYKYCHGGEYKNYNGACYPTDKSNNILWDAGKVSYTNCQ